MHLGYTGSQDIAHLFRDVSAMIWLRLIAAIATIIFAYSLWSPKTPEVLHCMIVLIILAAIYIIVTEL